MLLAGVALKFVPVIATVVPMGPLVGAKEMMAGTGTPIVKSVALRTVTQFVVTDILPVIVPAGTVVVILVAVLAVTVAVLLLKNITELFAGIVLKFVPEIVIDVPIDPEEGVNEAIVMGEILAIVLRSTDTVLLLRFTTARSALPSPSRSPMETE